MALFLGRIGKRAAAAQLTLAPPCTATTSLSVPKLESTATRSTCGESREIDRSRLARSANLVTVTRREVVVECHRCKLLGHSANGF